MSARPDTVRAHLKKLARDRRHVDVRLGHEPKAEDRELILGVFILVVPPPSAMLVWSWLGPVGSGVVVAGFPRCTLKGHCAEAAGRVVRGGRTSSGRRKIGEGAERRFETDQDSVYGDQRNGLLRGPRSGVEQR